jgi:hypothetical protein
MNILRIARSGRYRQADLRERQRHRTRPSSPWLGRIGRVGTCGAKGVFPVYPERVASVATYG